MRKIIYRTISLFVVSALCSTLTLFIDARYTMHGKTMLIPPTILFVAFIIYDGLRYIKWDKTPNKWVKLLVPFGVLAAVGISGYFFIKPYYYNFLFFPMRALEGFNIKSFESIILMNIIFFVIALLARYLPIKIKEFSQKRRNIKKKKLISELRKNYKKYS